MMDLHTYWWVLATEAELKIDHPLSRQLLDVPIVLFRDAVGQPAALIDRCPHRHAPLSGGQVRRGEVACPYHGWRFDATGCCTDVPGLETSLGHQPLVRSIRTCVAHGMVWACLSPADTTPPPVAPSISGNDLDTFMMTSTVHCTIPAAAENFLDGFHTHFVHAGWIRRDQKRQQVRARVRALPDGVEACYSEEGLQSGWISRLLESDRAESMGRFKLPGIAEIEYRGKKGLNVLITAWLTPETERQVRVHARIATRQGFAPQWLKKGVLQHLFGVILRQDKAILAQTERNIERFSQLPMTPPILLDTPLDLLGPAIRCLMNGEALPELNQNILLKL